MMNVGARTKWSWLVWHCLIFCLIDLAPLVAATSGGVTLPPVDERLRPIFRLESEKGAELYQNFSTLETNGDQILAFRAFVSRRWPSGLVPVYLVKKKERMALQRFPPRGQEGLIEPLFFALPTKGEDTNRNLLGRWECIATHEDGAEEYFAWDLTLRGSDLVGRFDVDTDFRFASILRGHFLKNQVRFDIQYIEAKYRLEGSLEQGDLEGEWSRVDEDGMGTWKALRPELPPPLPKGGLCHLWAFKKEGFPEIYRVEGQSIDSDWVREDQPICQVWR